MTGNGNGCPWLFGICICNDWRQLRGQGHFPSFLATQTRSVRTKGSQGGLRLPLTSSLSLSRCQLSLSTPTTPDRNDGFGQSLVNPVTSIFAYANNLDDDARRQQRQVLDWPGRMNFVRPRTSLNHPLCMDVLIANYATSLPTLNFK